MDEAHKNVQKEGREKGELGSSLASWWLIFSRLRIKSYQLPLKLACACMKASHSIPRPKMVLTSNPEFTPTKSNSDHIELSQTLRKESNHPHKNTSDRKSPEDKACESFSSILSYYLTTRESLDRLLSWVTESSQSGSIHVSPSLMPTSDEQVEAEKEMLKKLASDARRR
ncbi:hypothetical protein EMCG_02181 [[Emmonsia] crescens]|uniref:Uncharacterized protein n=1 Tax=[Emmonsia] crescens TaxID=73230 RepID=A0A0G2J981_9EURO|nr:hypothetical protein EMCG_02181 [Emmonsia crescens UAMH 3008]